MKTIFPLSSDTLLYQKGDDLYRMTAGSTTGTVVHDFPGGSSHSGPDTPHSILELPAGHPHAGRLIAGGNPVYSDDRGASWTEATIPAGTESALYRFAAMPSGRILVLTTRGVAASDDGGESYGRPVAENGLNGSPMVLAAFATPGSVQSGAPDCGLDDRSLCDGALVFASSGLTPQGGAVWRTNDGGRSWSAATHLPQPDDGIASSYWSGVAVLASEPGGLGRAVTVSARGVVYVTRDGGVTWDAVGRMPFGVDSQIDIQLAMLLRLGPDGHLWVAAPTNRQPRVDLPERGTRRGRVRGLV